MLLLLISFMAGILTILAPCVLPVLPVMIGGTVSATAKDQLRPYLIALSLTFSIIGFTLLLKVSTLLVSLSPQVLTDVSGSLLVLLGLVAVVPELWEWLVVACNVQAASQRLLGKSEHTAGRYVGPIVIGLALGPVFTSCSPTYAFILASVLPHSLAGGLMYLTAYSVGLVAALLVAALAGRKLLVRFNWAVDTHSVFRRAVGVLFVLLGILIVNGQLVNLEVWLANRLPFDETGIERVLLAKQNQSSLASQMGNAFADSSVLNVPATPAPALRGLTNWINSPPLTLAALHGKVVLVDFWTYSCINCIRSLPYVEKWYQAYHSKGLEIIGINTPEFAFEHDPANVQAAVVKDGIHYPVALDNNYVTWNAFNNDSWPADYLIDKSGAIRYVSLGEGDYDKTEQAIQLLLGINQPLQTSAYAVPITQAQTPETYFGTARAQNYAGSPDLANGTANFTLAASLGGDQWTLGGTWQISDHSITSQNDNAILAFKVEAKDVYVVASSGGTGQIKVGLSANATGQYGSDVTNGVVMVNSSRLYHIVSLKQFGSATILVTVPKGVSLYTFTFGS